MKETSYEVALNLKYSNLLSLFYFRTPGSFCFVLIWGGGQGWNLEIEKGKRTGKRGSDRDMAKARVDSEAFVETR